MPTGTSVTAGSRKDEDAARGVLTLRDERNHKVDLAERQQAGLNALNSIAAYQQAARYPARHAQPAPMLPPRTVHQPARPSEQPMRGPRIVYMLMFSVGLLLLARFGYFWFTTARLPRDFGRHLDAGDIVLFAALTFVVWHRVLIDFSSWLICGRVD